MFFQKWQHFLDKGVGGDAVLFAKDRNRSVLDEFIRPSDANDGRVNVLRVQMLDDGAAEAVVEHVIFERADNFHAAREKLERPGVHRLDPARIDQGHGDAVFLELPGGFLRHFEHIPKAEDGDVTSVLDNLSLADVE